MYLSVKSKESSKHKFRIGKKLDKVIAVLTSILEKTGKCTICVYVILHLIPKSMVFLAFTPSKEYQ